MSTEAKEKIKRSVDSLARIYAVVIALAISQAVQILIREPDGSGVVSWSAILTAAPAFVAFVVTLVPFWHGMSRHLDRCYLEKNEGIVQGALLLDLVVFFIEAGLLFAAGWALRLGLVSFYCLGLLLVVDMVWSFVSHLIHSRKEKSHSKNWSLINVCVGVVAILVAMFQFEPKSTALMVVAIGRTIADYYFCYEFYFPTS